MDKLAFLQNWFQRVWIDGDLDAIGEFFTPNSQAAGVMQGLDLRPEDFEELIPALMRMMSAPTVTILRHLETEDWLWALLVVRAKTADTLSPIEFTAQVAMRFDNGRIAEAFNHFDLLSFFEQLGVLPPEAMALFLSGESLT